VFKKVIRMKKELELIKRNKENKKRGIIKE
jgi:hypothetical protein